MYLIRWGRLFLEGFCLNGSSRWVISPEDAIWLPLERANKLVFTLKELEDISAEVEVV